MKKNLAFLLLFAVFRLHAQMGVGGDPDASAQLDVSSSDKGLLIPRVSLNNVADTTLDGTHKAATGLMIYNTNASLTGGDGTGFYYFDGNRWIKLVPQTKNIHVICIDNNQVTVTTGSGQDVSGYDAALEPIFFNSQGNLEVKLIIRYSSIQGSARFQLRAHDDTHEDWPIVWTDFGVFATTQTGGVATSDWRPWNAGTHAYEIHLFAWIDNPNDGDHVTIESAYLLVRSQ